MVPSSSMRCRVPLPQRIPPIVRLNSATKSARRGQLRKHSRCMVASENRHNACTGDSIKCIELTRSWVSLMTSSQIGHFVFPSNSNAINSPTYLPSQRPLLAVLSLRADGTTHMQTSGRGSEQQSCHSEPRSLPPHRLPHTRVHRPNPQGSCTEAARCSRKSGLRGRDKRQRRCQILPSGRFLGGWQGRSDRASL